MIVTVLDMSKSSGDNTADAKGRQARDASIKQAGKDNADLSRVMAVPKSSPTERIHQTTRASSRQHDRNAGRDV